MHQPLLLLPLLLLLAHVQAWQKYTPTGSTQPAARRDHSAIQYANKLVIFGGKALYARSNTAIQTTPPLSAQCLSHHNCYAALNRGTCVNNATCACKDGYGGESCELEEGDKIYDDVSVFNIDTSTWSIRGRPLQATTSQWPSARFGHTAAVIDNQMIVYGGRSHECIDYCSDVWEYTLTAVGSNSNGTWTRVAAKGPGARALHTAVVWKRQLVVFGGMRASGLLNDFWLYLFDGQRRWRTVPFSVLAAQPCVRAGHSMVVHNDNLYVYGGFTSPAVFVSNRASAGSAFYLDDLWTINLVNSTSGGGGFGGEWTRLASASALRPTARMFASMAPADYGVILMFGGVQYDAFDAVTWQYNVSTDQWLHKPLYLGLVELPAARAATSMTRVATRSSVFVFGGYSRAPVALPQETVYNDIWVLNTTYCYDNCNDRGECKSGMCICNSGYYGDSCQSERCADTTCTISAGWKQDCVHCSNGNGICYRGECLCDATHSGVTCANTVS